MAIYNPRFFTLKYRDLPGVFAHAENAEAWVADFIRGSRVRDHYESIAARQMETVAANYRRKDYLANLCSFYETHFHP